jgi:pyruvate dehydrogenase E2 component (dihydrolipoamide acetyltransferase)
MIRDIFMPALSSTMTEGTIASWLKSPGDKVAKGETVVVVTSDKADMDVESFYEGYLATILVEAGQEAPVGMTIALIAETQEEIAQAQAQGKSTQASTPAATSPVPVQAEPVPTPVVTVPEPTPIAATTVTRSNGRLVASPRAKKLAKEHGIDLKTLQGSGPHGRIVAEDVLQAAGKPQATVAPQLLVTPAIPTAQKSVQTTTPAAPILLKGELVPLNTLQKAVVQNMVASLQVPVFRVSYTITTDALDQLYKQIKSKGVTMTALIAKAVAVALQRHPILNASYVEQNGQAAIQYHPSINIAVAVEMGDGGLITPVLQNAHQMDIYSLSRTWKDLVERARTKKLQPDEYTSGTFTVSNLGTHGVDRFDAILPPGQGAILAIGTARPQVVATADGMIGVKRQMTVNITCDHRIIYGADAASFLGELAKVIEIETQSLTL